MAEDITVTLAVEIEIRVVCEVDHGRCVRLGSKSKAKFALLCPFVTCYCFYSTWIALLTILRIIHELDSSLMLTAFPNLVLETLRTTMEMVRAIVYRKSVLHSVESELSKSYTVGITARNLASARSVSEIAGRLRISENNIGEIAILVRNNH
jgi:hypothetical protein